MGDIVSQRTVVKLFRQYIIGTVDARNVS
jgi:hypothetical protein